MNVGQGFLENAKEYEFRGARQTAEFVGDVGGQVDAAAFGEAFGVPASGGGQADFVEQRRMEQMRDGAGFGYGFGEEFVDFILELQHTDAQTARVFFGAFALGEFAAQEAEVNPEEQDGESEHGQQNTDSNHEEGAGKLFALAEELLLFVRELRRPSLDLGPRGAPGENHD